MTKGRCALLVEDDESARRALQLALHWRGFDVASFASVARALESGIVDAVDILVAAYRLHDGNGIDVLRALVARGWSGRAVLVTTFPTAAVHRDAIAGGFHVVLEKPLRRQQVLNAIGV
ncbi:MAG TPA: response regulator [Sphingomonas sp.]|nr:response regulator [Sphingomonas sp.]